MKYKQTHVNLCADCNDLAYKTRDAANEKNNDVYEKHIHEWAKRTKKPSGTFLLWQEEFLASLKRT